MRKATTAANWLPAETYAAGHVEQVGGARPAAGLHAAMPGCAVLPPRQAAAAPQACFVGFLASVLAQSTRKARGAHHSSRLQMQFVARQARTRLGACTARRRCHFGPCPPCPLACGSLLACSHGCAAAGCHDAVPPDVPEFQQPEPPRQSALQAALDSDRAPAASAHVGHPLSLPTAGARKESCPFCFCAEEGTEGGEGPAIYIATFETSQTMGREGV